MVSSRVDFLSLGPHQVNIGNRLVPIDLREKMANPTLAVGPEGSGWKLHYMP